MAGNVLLSQQSPEHFVTLAGAARSICEEGAPSEGPSAHEGALLAEALANVCWFFHGATTQPEIEARAFFAGEQARDGRDVVGAGRLAIVQFLAEPGRIDHMHSTKEILDHVPTSTRGAGSANVNSLITSAETLGTPEYRAVNDIFSSVSGNRRQSEAGLVSRGPDSVVQTTPEEMDRSMDASQCFDFFARAYLYARAALSRNAEGVDLGPLAMRSFDDLAWLAKEFRMRGYANHGQPSSEDGTLPSLNRGDACVLPIDGVPYDVAGAEKDRINLLWIMADHAGRRYHSPEWTRFLVSDDGSSRHPDTNFRKMIQKIDRPGTPESAIRPVFINAGQRGWGEFGIKGSRLSDEFAGIPTFQSTRNNGPDGSTGTRSSGRSPSQRTNKQPASPPRQLSPEEGQRFRERKARRQRVLARLDEERRRSK